MKILKIFALCSLVAISGQSFAKTVPIVFAKESHCGSFNGDFKGKTFTMQLNKNQILEIDGLKYITPTAPTVKDPKGRVLTNDGWLTEEMVRYETTLTGKYTIILDSEDYDDHYADVKFCAYNQ